MKNLFFRRQFILSNKPLDMDPEWTRTELSIFGSGYTVYAHPDLDLQKTENELFQLILLGYIINPQDPSRTDEDIIADLAKEGTFLKIVEATNALNGRFVIIFNDRNSIKVFNDATGLREVYYMHAGDTIACGSTPSIISKHFAISLDTDAKIQKFFHSNEFNTPERIWIGDRTIYKNVKHLLPNHFLDLISGETKRFWPVISRKILDLDDVAEKMIGILQGTFAAACNRYDLHQGLTSGWDTRLLLATGKNHMDKIHYYFFRGYKADKYNSPSPDYEVAMNISRDHNIPLEIITVKDQKIDEEFERIYFQNNVLARPKLLPIFYDAYAKKLDHTKAITGTMGNEILRLVSSIARKSQDSKKIAKRINYQNDAYAVESIDAWVNASKHLADMNYLLIDLFFWEQYIGNWGALSASEQDIVRDEIRPFNNREFLFTYISLHDKNRYRDFPMGHIKMIEILWNDLLAYRIDLSLYDMKKILRTIGLEQFADRIYQHMMQR